jgi:signal transduction histidine kinase
MEYRLRRHDGEYRWILDTGVPRFSPNGEFMGYVGSGVDITDKKQAEESNRDLAHLQRLVAMGELMTAIAHGLAQPVTAIGFNLDAIEGPLRAGKLDVEALKEVLHAIRVDTGRVLEVIELIRDLALRRQILSEPLDLESLFAGTLQLLASEVLRRRIQVRTELHPGLPLVVANRAQLQQVLINLALNGMEAMATAKTRQLTVKATANGGDYVEVAVADCGDGIDPTIMPHLFKRFVTTKREGIGLGLFVARSIIESQRGKIWTSNNPGGGTTFHFTVPLAQEPARV